MDGNCACSGCLILIGIADLVLCMGAHTSIVPEPSAGRAILQHSPREGSWCLPSLLAGSH